MGNSQVAEGRYLNSLALRTDSLKGISLGAMFSGYVWTAVVLGAFSVDVPAVAWVGSTLLFGVSSATYLLAIRRPREASILLIVGLLASVSCLVYASPSPHAPYLFILVITVASTLLGCRWLLLTLVAAVVLTVGLDGGQTTWPLRLPELRYPIAILSLFAVVSFVSARSINVALDWVWSAYQMAIRNETLANERRAELRRVLNALQEATGRLARANEELTIARQQAEEARALQEQFVANVSHELRTPLNLVVGFAEMMYLTPETYAGVTWTPDLLSDIAATYRASRQLQNLVDDVLDLSRIDAARLPIMREQADLGRVVVDAVETIAPLLDQHKLTYDVDVPPDLPSLLIDPTRIRQVMLNLLNNALRFTDAGGIHVRIAREPDCLRVSVEDTGIGIPAEQMERIFTKFGQVDSSTRRRGGTGLGLTISQQFVQVHGGRMWAESEIGVGSTFHFTLPLSGTLCQPLRLGRPTTARGPEPSKAPIVAVDPDPSIGHMLARHLGDRAVIVVSDVAEAEAAIEDEHPLAIVVNQRPDLPPDAWCGEIGPAAARRNVPVVRCSIPSPSWLMAIAGIQACLTKPVSRETLAAVIRRYFAQPCHTLIVDDNAGFLGLVSRMLRAENLASGILLAHGGEEALRLVRAERPQLILLDLLMPDMNGFEVVSQLREEGALDGMVVVALTATSLGEEVLRRSAGSFTISQAQGIPTRQVIDLINASLEVLHPDYTTDPSSACTD